MAEIAQVEAERARLEAEARAIYESKERARREDIAIKEAMRAAFEAEKQARQNEAVMKQQLSMKKSEDVPSKPMVRLRSPPPPSPKPKRPILQKPAPSPKPTLRTKPLPPPAKPKIGIPRSVLEPGKPIQPVLEPGKPIQQVLEPGKAVQPVESKPAIYSLHEKEGAEVFVPNRTGFAEAQAQLARNLKGTVKRGNSLNAIDIQGAAVPVRVSKPPPGPIKPSSQLPLKTMETPPAYQPRAPSPVPDSEPYQPRPPTPGSPENFLPLEDLPPPPPDLLEESPQDQITPCNSKISEMVKNLSTQNEDSASLVKKIDVVEGEERHNSVSQLTSMLNKTLKKSQTSSMLINQPLPPKPPIKAPPGKMNRSMTCPQIGSPTKEPSHPQPHPRSTSVHQRAADLASSLVLQRPVDPNQSTPVRQVLCDMQVPLPPPQQFSNQFHPPLQPQAMQPLLDQQQTMVNPPISPYAAPIQRLSNQPVPLRVPPKPPMYQAPQQPLAAPQPALATQVLPSQAAHNFQGTPVPPSRIPGPMRAPPPVVPPVSNYQVPPLPSRKDSLVASKHRDRSTSDSSGGSHNAPAMMRPGHSDILTPPPRTTSSLVRRETATTANTVNTAGQPPDMGRRQELALRHPQHIPPTASFPKPPSRTASNASSAGPPARSWHDTLLRDNPSGRL